AGPRARTGGRPPARRSRDAASESRGRGDRDRAPSAHSPTLVRLSGPLPNRRRGVRAARATRPPRTRSAAAAPLPPGHGRSDAPAHGARHEDRRSSRFWLHGLGRLRLLIAVTAGG